MGRKSRTKGITYMNRVAKLMRSATGRSWKRNLEEYRTANDGDVAEEVALTNGNLDRLPLPLWIEAKHYAGGTPWRDALLQAIEGVEDLGDDTIPVGWARLERFVHPESVDVVALRPRDVRRLTHALITIGVWTFPPPWVRKKVEGRRPRWKDPLREVLASPESDIYPVQFRVVARGDRPLDAILTTEEDFIDILAKLTAFNGWAHVRRTPF